MKDIYHNETNSCIAYLMGPVDSHPILPEAEKVWLLTGIRTFPTKRGRGYASRLLRTICHDADAENVRLILKAEAEDWDNLQHPGLSQSALVAFYTRHGFKMVIEEEQTMIR